MKLKLLFIAIIAFTVLFSCNLKHENEQGYADMQVTYATPQVRDESGSAFKENVTSNNSVSEEDKPESFLIKNNLPVDKKKIIRDGSISIKSNNIFSSKKSIDDLIRKLNAYYETEELQNNEQIIEYNLKIRVPAVNFEKLISAIETGQDEISNKSIQARDVTEEYVDIISRLSNKRQYLKRYKELLAKAGSVKEILSIEENIRTLEEEIESKEGHLKFLNDQISYSTLLINLYAKREFVYKPLPKDKFSENVKKSLSNGWSSVVNFVLWLISTWPFIILILILLFIGKWVLKKNKKMN